MDIKSALKMVKSGIKPKYFGYRLDNLDLGKHGEIQYAQWLHPLALPPTEINEAHIDELCKYLKEGDIAVDVGAGVGDISILLSLAVGASGSVLAFEPNKYIFPILQKNAALNHILPFKLAATEEDGKFIFHYGDAGYCAGGATRWNLYRLKVEGVNLGKYLADKKGIRFIKIDTEGFDLAVIKSMRDLILEQKPYIKAEVFIHLNSDQRAKLISNLWQLGYSVFKVEGNNYKGEIISYDNLMKWKHYDIFCVPKGRNG